MNELFMQLLYFLKDHGNITSANWSKDSTYSSIDLEDEDCIYSISIRKEEKKGETENAE